MLFFHTKLLFIQGYLQIPKRFGFHFSTLPISYQSHATITPRTCGFQRTLTAEPVRGLSWTVLLSLLSSQV